MASIARVYNTNINSIYCQNNKVTFGVGITITPLPSVAAGLANVEATVLLKGQSVDIADFESFGFKPVVTSNKFTFSEVENQPSVGGQVSLNAPCNYSAPLPIESDIKISYASNVPMTQTFEKTSDSEPSSNETTVITTTIRQVRCMNNFLEVVFNLNISPTPRMTTTGLSNLTGVVAFNNGAVDLISSFVYGGAHLNNTQNQLLLSEIDNGPNVDASVAIQVECKDNATPKNATIGITWSENGKSIVNKQL